MAPTGKWRAPPKLQRAKLPNPRPIPGLSSEVWNLIAKASHKRPERRYQSMREFRSALGVVVAGVKASESQPYSVPKYSSWASLGQPVIVGFVVGSVLAAGLFRLKHSPASEAKATTVVSVPSIRNERVTSQDGRVVPRFPQSAVVTSTAFPVATTSNSTSKFSYRGLYEAPK